jgi:hypothetical protein
MAMSSYFGCFRLRQPLPAETGGGISGGSMGNPDSPAEAAMPPTQAARVLEKSAAVPLQALYPPRLTTVAWPGPACRGDTT